MGDDATANHTHHRADAFVAARSEQRGLSTPRAAEKSNRARPDAPVLQKSGGAGAPLEGHLFQDRRDAGGTDAGQRQHRATLAGKNACVGLVRTSPRPTEHHNPGRHHLVGRRVGKREGCARQPDTTDGTSMTVCCQTLNPSPSHACAVAIEKGRRGG